MSNLWVTTEDLGIYADSDYAYEAVKTASYLLWAMSGRKFSGITTVTERYVSSHDPYLRVGGSRLTYYPTLINGQVENIPTGGFGRYSHHDYLGDGTSSYSRVRLRGRKVIEVHALRDKDGEIYDPSTYYLAEGSTVYGTPDAKWSPFNVEVSYTYGSPPPASGRAAARILATELVKFYEDDDTCALPQRVTSVTRQGVTYTILDNQSFIDEMRTGIYAVDLFLKTANPDRARARSRVFSPDLGRARRIPGKRPAFVLSSYDMYYDSSGARNVFYTNELNADFLLNDSSWTVYPVIYSYDNSRQKTLSSAAHLDDSDGTIRVSLEYSDIIETVGSRDPGTFDLYASRPSLGNPEIEEIVNLTVGNIIFKADGRLKEIVVAN